MQLKEDITKDGRKCITLPPVMLQFQLQSIPKI